MRKSKLITLIIPQSLGLILLLSIGCHEKTRKAVRTSIPPPKPNILFIMADDLGYGDLGCFGATEIKTPNIDRLCDEGMKFTDFHVHERCSPSRAAFLTGSYAPRVGIKRIVKPEDNIGLNQKEIVVPELLKKQGYRTAMIGKWHLGVWEPFRPEHHGFDYIFHGEHTGHKPIDWKSFRKNGYIKVKGKRRFPRLLKDNIEARAYDEGASKMNAAEQLTSEAIKFLKDTKDQPFFLYFSHYMPHVPLIPSKRFKGTSGRGLYGDLVQELDWSVGEVLKTLDELDLAKNTLVIFCSDNGPMLKSKGADSGGESGPLRDGKWSQFEGGTRTPFVVRWPGKIKPGSTNNNIIGIIDMLPTFCNISGAKVPTNRIIDGIDVAACFNDNTIEIRQTFAYLGIDGLIAYRYKQWKLFVKKWGAGYGDDNCTINDLKEILSKYGYREVLRYNFVKKTGHFDVIFIGENVKLTNRGYRISLRSQENLKITYDL